MSKEWSQLLPGGRDNQGNMVAVRRRLVLVDKAYLVIISKED